MDFTATESWKKVNEIKKHKFSNIFQFSNSDEKYNVKAWNFKSPL